MAAVTGERFAPQTRMSAASTTEAVSRSAWTPWAATNAGATLLTSSTGIKKTVWVRGAEARAQCAGSPLAQQHYPTSPWSHRTRSAADQSSTAFSSPELQQPFFKSFKNRRYFAGPWGFPSVLLRRLELTSVFLVAFLYEKNRVQGAPLPWGK